MAQTDELIYRASQKINSLEEFFNLGRDCLESLENVDFAPVSSSQYQNYILPIVPESGAYLRPINKNLFVTDALELDIHHANFIHLTKQLQNIKENLDSLNRELKQFIEKGYIVKSIYTTLQAIGCVLDTSIDTQASRKNFGQRFEDFVKALLNQLGIANDDFRLKIKIPAINRYYRVLPDVIMNTSGEIRSSRSVFDVRDTILSVKTASKDRMKLIFVDRFALKRILNSEEINYIALYHNDVQRSGTKGIRSTFVPDHYLVFCYVFGDLPLYYLDPPIISKDSRFHEKIKTFDTFILHDIWNR